MAANTDLFSANTSALATDFNVTPYYDDYDAAKQFYRILFKPGYSVQARELTQMQTMMQSQIERFGKHVFKEGSIVIPGQFNIDTAANYVKIQDTDTSNNPITAAEFKDLIITSSNTSVKAYVQDTIEGTQSSSNTKTLYISYTSASPANSAQTVFTAGETLTSNVGSFRVLSTSPIGKGSRFTIREGIIFAKGHFIYFPTQSIVLSRYSQNPSCRVGFYIDEQIINASRDSSLLDPAQEASNFAAPGADRLKLLPELQILPIDSADDVPNFVELFTIRDGVITERYDRSQYAVIQDEIAKRTYDESGDYYVRGLDVRVRENLNINNNGGLDANGNTSLLSIGVEPGTGYVKGYEINKLVTDYISVPKANTYANVSGQVGTVSLGSYVFANQISGSVTHDNGTLVNLHSGYGRKLSGKAWASSTPASPVIGTARVASVDYDTGTLGTPDGTARIYLMDIRMLGSNSFAEVKALDNTDFGADVIPENNGRTVIYDTLSSSLIYPVGSLAVRTLRDSAGSPDMVFNFKRTSSVTINDDGTLVVDLNFDSLETFPYGTSTLTNPDKREIILTLGASANIAGPGTCFGTAACNAITGIGTDFTRFNVGDKIEFRNSNQTFFINTISSATAMTLTENLPGGFVLSGNNYFKAYKVGDVIDLTTKGFESGSSRIVQTIDTQMTIDLSESFSGDIPNSLITYQVVRRQAKEVTKLLRDNRYVKIHVGSQPSPRGPFNLGFSDIFLIRKVVRKSSSYPTSLTDGTDVTNLFAYDSGQRDSFYDHGSMTPTNISLTANDYLLVQLDYFEPSFTLGRGYFSVDSYPINDNIVSNTTIRTEQVPLYQSILTGIGYDLRDCIDFRPMKLNTATDATTIAGATTNPAISSGFNFESNGMRLPVPASQYTFDYSHYLPRRDVVGVDKVGVVSAVLGTPASNPSIPTIPENIMGLATVYIAPYPSLSPQYAQQIGRVNLSCGTTKISNVRYTMRDIAVLDNRINNIEYYTALNLLEKSAVDLQVLDSDNIPRFKNGFFVDNFVNHTSGDTANPSYKIVVDPQEKTIRPLYDIRSYYYDYVSGTGVTKIGDLIMLPYTEVTLMEQLRATTFRNVELSSYRFLGEMFLFPDTDVWVDTDQLVDQGVSMGPTESDLPPSLKTWNDWQTKLVGQSSTSSTSSYISGVRSGSSTKYTTTNDGGVTGPTEWTYLSQQELNNLQSGSLGGGRYTSPNLYGSAWGWCGNRFQRTAQTTTFTTTATTLNQTETDTTFVTTTATTLNYQQNRTGTETVYSIGSDSKSLGNRVVNIDFPAYIRPQGVGVVVRGLKAFGRYYTLFDGEFVNDLVAPLTQTQLTEFLNGQAVSGSTPVEGGPLIADASGNVYFVFRIPPGRFRIGSRELKVIDSPTNSQEDATSWAKKAFVSQGFVQQKQNTVLTTRWINISQTALNDTSSWSDTVFTSSSYVKTDTQVSIDVSQTQSKTTQYTYVDYRSCSAYSFIPKTLSSEEGLFLTSVDLWFAQKDPTLGVWFEIREMNSAGGITRTQVPFSEKWLLSSEVNVSSNASVPTRITFPSPVFLYNDTQYAFVIHTEGLNPNYALWVSRLGEKDITTGNFVNSRPLTGTFYTTNNNLNWLPVDGLDLKIRFNRASFTTGVTGTAILGNRPMERLVIANSSSEFSNVGERVIGPTGRGLLSRYKSLTTGSTIELIGSSGTFTANQNVRCEISGAFANVESARDFRYSVVDFEPAFLKFNKTPIRFEMRTTSNTATTGTYFPITENTNYYFNSEMTILRRTNETALIGGEQSNRVRVSFYTATDFLSPILDLGRTHGIYVDNQINANTVGETYSTVTLTVNSNSQFLTTGSWINAAVSGANSSILTVSGNTIRADVKNAEFIIGDRLTFVNNSTTYTTHITDLYGRHDAYVGNLENKYISRIVTLADGQDAEDVQVFLSAYRPPSTDVKVWIRIMAVDDLDTFTNIPWIELGKTGNDLFSSIANRNDFREFRYGFPNAFLTGTLGGATNVVQYRNSLGVTHTGFKYFQIKIGLIGTNAAVIPRVGDLRVIALQK